MKSTRIGAPILIESTGVFHPRPLKKTSETEQRNVVGRRLRAIRLSKEPKVTLEDLAGRLAARGITLDRSAVGRIENGQRYVLDYEAVALAKALGVKLRDIFGQE